MTNDFLTNNWIIHEKRRFLFAILTCLISFGCVESTSSEVKHKRNNIVATENYPWQELSFDKFKTMFLSEYDSHNLLDAESDLDKQLLRMFNEIVDLIEINLSIKEDLDHFPPRPGLVKIDSKDSNAFVENSYTCYLPENSKIEPSTAGLLFESKAGPMELYFEQCHKFIKIEDFQSDDVAKKLLLAHGAEELDGCEIRSDIRHLQLSCNEFSEKYTFFAVNRVPNWVVLTTGLIEKIKDPRKILTAIAHELAHYYLGHTSQNLWMPYLETTLGRIDGVPKEYLAGYEILSFLEANNDLIFSSKIEGSRFNPMVFNLLREISKFESCALGQQYDDLTLLIDHEDVITQGLEVRYLDFESELLECAREIKQSSLTSAQHSKLKFSLITLTRGFNSSEKFLRHLPGMVVAEDPKNLLDFIEGVSEEFDKFGTAISEFRQKAVDLKLGFYTNEQEADEVSLEYLSYYDRKIALNAPKFYIDLINNSSERKACSDGVHEVELGESFYWPIKDWLDPHHSPCYRAVNLAREIYFHGY